MTYSEALDIYNKILRYKSASDSDFNELLLDMYKAAVEYAHTRAMWIFMSHEERANADVGRTMQHDAFIARFSILARYCLRKYNCDLSDVCRLNRKELGDLACFIHSFKGVEMR